MENVTTRLANARECIRDLWNQHYRHLCVAADPFDVIDCYKSIRSRIVADFLQLESERPPQIYVAIGESVDPRSVFVKQVQVPQIVVWKPCESASQFANKLFPFVDFFDFGERNLIELRYVETSNPETGTNNFLFEFIYCQFFTTQ